jgi:hypothetical protein
VKEKPVAPTTEPSTEPPKKRKSPLLFIILFLLFLAFCIFAVVMRIRDPNITLWKLLRLQNVSILPKKPVIQTRTPKPILDKKVTKTVDGKNGGTVSLTSANGYRYDVIVEPGKFTGNVTVNVAPLEEPPFTYPSAGSGQGPGGQAGQNPNTGGNPNQPDPNNPDPNPPPNEPPDPGVDITVDPPPPPPPPPDADDPFSGDEDTGIVIHVFPPGATLTLDASEPDPNQIAADMLSKLGLGTIPGITVPNKEEKPEAKTPSGTSVPPDTIIFIPRNSTTAHIQPTSPVWGSGSNRDNPPDGTGSNIDGGGTATPDDSKGKKGEDQAGQAAANANGRCTAEFINAAANMAGTTGLGGQYDASNRYMGLMEECRDEILGYIKRLCQSDRRLLRRRDFNVAKRLLALTRASTDVMNELTTLEQSCTGYYTITTHATPVNRNGVNVESTIDASTCGYFDDTWSSKNTYTLTVEGGVAHSYEGQQEFSLPPQGGMFGGQDTSGSHKFIDPAIGAILPKLGVGGTFDGRYTVYAWVYPIPTPLVIEIPLVSTTCPSNTPEPLIAPLGK